MTVPVEGHRPCRYIQAGAVVIQLPVHQYQQPAGVSMKAILVEVVTFFENAALADRCLSILVTILL